MHYRAAIVRCQEFALPHNKSARRGSRCLITGSVFQCKEEEMGVRRESKHEVIEAMRRRYRGAGRAEKGRLIEEAAAVTGYHRRYAQALLHKGVPYSGPRLRRS